MLPKTVCRVCLVENLNLYDVRNKLQNAYERITREKYNKDEYPISMCYICLSALQKCLRFMETAQDSNEWLKQWYKSKGKTKMRVAKPLVVYLVSKVEVTAYNEDICFENYNIKQEKVYIEVPIEYTSTKRKLHEDIEKLEIYNDDLSLERDYLDTELPPKRRRTTSDSEPQNDISQTYPYRGVIGDEPEIHIKEEIIVTDTKDTNLTHESADNIVANKVSHTNISNFKPEILKPKSKMPHICNICNKTLATAFGLKRHVIRKHSITHSNIKKPKIKRIKVIKNIEKLYICSDCSYRSKKRRLFLSHLKIHSDKKPFGLKTTKKCKPAICEVCDLKLSSISCLKRHIMQKHPSSTNLEIEKGYKMYSCNDCSYESKNRSCFISHLITHSGVKPYACEICDYRCARKSQLAEHMITHTGTEKSFLCHFCHYKCKRKKQLNDHVRTHTGERPFACTICDFKSKQRCQLIVHMRTHTGERPFSCELCDYTCKQKGHLDRHMKSHSGIKPFSCNKCNYSFAVRGALKAHMRTHTGEKPFSCDMCQYRGATKFHLQSHKRNIHGDNIMSDTRTENTENLLSCHICGHKFKWQVNLNKHMKRHEKPPLICDLCGYTCEYEHDFTRHVRTHTGEKPFSCDICDSKFVRKSQLPIHMRIHSGEKPFLCHICDFKFTQKQQLDRHLLTHTDEKPFSCDVCNLKFTRNSHLTTHLRIHTGEKPFLCDQCDYKCISKANLKKHKMRTHK